MDFKYIVLTKEKKPYYGTIEGSEGLDIDEILDICAEDIVPLIEEDLKDDDFVECLEVWDVEH
jgi:hypothetical protein